MIANEMSLLTARVIVSLLRLILIIVLAFVIKNLFAENTTRESSVSSIKLHPFVSVRRLRLAVLPLLFSFFLSSSFILQKYILWLKSPL